jgi:D-inositol-3-phosphate glycosyltransferase
VRVLLVSANFRPRIGGIERFTEILAGGLARRGHEVSVVCCRYDRAPLREELDGFSVERIPASYALDRSLDLPYPLPEPVRFALSLRRRVAEADVVHVQDVLYATSLPALAFAARRQVPAVLTQHVGFVPQRSAALDAVERAALATIGRCVRLATVVATLNPAVAVWVEERWNVRGVRVLPVGVPPAAERPDRAEFRRRFGLPADRFVALFVGRDVPKKGLDIVLAAADPAYELVAVTDRPPRPGGPRLLPFMSPDRLRELMSCSDAFVLPSEGEGFPLSLQEALAAGLPVVTTLQPGYESFLSAEDVLFVERDAEAVRRALQRLAAEPELRARLSERGRDVVRRHFGAERFIEAYEALYEEARASRLGGSPAAVPRTGWPRGPVAP